MIAPLPSRTRCRPCTVLRLGRGAILLSVLVAGCAPPGDLDRARALLQAGKLAPACRLLERLLEEAKPPELQLETLRTRIDCLARSGRLEQAATWLEGRPPGSALRLYGEALLAVARTPAGLTEALALLERAGGLWPQVGEIPYRAGVLLLADEQPAASLPLLTRAFRLASTAACAAARAHALLDLGRTEDALRAIAELPRHRPRPADVARGRGLVQRIARRSAAVPPQAEERLRRGRELAEGRPGDALRILESLCTDFPRLAPTHTLLGLVHLRLANMAEAVVALRRASELNPLDAQAPLFLAVILESRGRGGDAVRSYRTALRLDPFQVGAAQRLGELLLKRGAARQAAEVLDHARAVDNDGPKSLRLAGRAHLAAGAPGPAEDCFRRLLEREPQDFEANLRMAQILLGQQARDGSAAMRRRAARYLEQAAATHPGDPEVEQLRLQLPPAR